jgi:hypothetical protein
MASINSVDTFGSASIDELLSVNDLTFLADNETNIVVERSQKKTYSQKTSYEAGEVIVLQLNTGSDYISWLDSTLRIKLNITQDFNNSSSTTFGGGSVLNLFENIRLISRSGVVLTEINKLNLWNFFSLKLNHTREWRKGQQGFELLGVDQPVLPENEYIIPLGDICGFFQDEVLSPSSLCSGMRIELTCATINNAYQCPVTVGVNTAITASVISGIELNLDSYRLSAGAMSALNSMAASSGLVLTFPDINNSKFNKAVGSTSFNAEVRQSVSMANQVYAVVRDSANVGNPTTDSFTVLPPTATSSYQYRVASIYLPQVPVVGPKQYYAQLSYVRGDTRSGREVGFRGDVANNNALACATIARYSTKGSGMALNNSTNLTLQMTVSAVASDIDVFLMHTKRVVVFLESVTVSE